MTTLLEVSGVSVSFDGFRAINNLSIAIAGHPQKRRKPDRGRRQTRGLCRCKGLKPLTSLKPCHLIPRRSSPAGDFFCPRCHIPEGSMAVS